MAAIAHTKRKYSQTSDGKATATPYHVKRPKVSSEYQGRMGAIDGHNYRRQSGKSCGAMEKLCVTRNTKDRIFISIASWILINIYLLQKYFLWGGEAKKGPGELQEQIAMALINNSLHKERQVDKEPDPDFPSEGEDEQDNDPLDSVNHPEYKQALCRVCYKHDTVYICKRCSKPGEKKVRCDTGPKGGERITQLGFMHFCKSGCFDRHRCGSVKSRRTKKQMATAALRKNRAAEIGRRVE